MIDWTNPSDDVIEARRIGYEERDAELVETIDSLASEVERLKSREITAEQIDKAWAMATGNQPEGIWVMEELGIVECPECGGSGEHHIDYPMANGRIERNTVCCSRCHGHKWIREERQR